VIDEAEQLAAVLDGESTAGFAGDPGLLLVASEITHAFASWRLGDRDRVRLLNRAMGMTARTLPASRSRVGGLPARARAAIRSPRVGRRTSAVLGGAALVAVAAIGVTVARHRRVNGPAAA
jgi:hypothetical protein